MPLTSMVATNEDAEKLLKYLLSYRNRLDNPIAELEPESEPESHVSIAAIPLEEALIASTENRRIPR